MFVMSSGRRGATIAPRRNLGNWHDHSLITGNDVGCLIDRS